VPEANDEFDYFARQAGSYRVFFLKNLRFGHFGKGVLSAVSDSTGPLNQSEGVTRQPIELVRIGLASGVLQCIDSSAAKLLRILRSLGGIQVGHCR
jgi:hypothetical protein